MNEKNFRGIFLKFSEADDKLLDFVLNKEKITNQTEGFRRALKCYQDNSEQLAILKQLVENQNEIKNLLREFCFRAESNG